MINLMNLVEGRYDYGCVMAQIDENASAKLLEFNYKRISEDILFVEEQGFGRENHPHITIKYGLVNSYSEDQMREILKEVAPFKVQLKGIGIFEGDSRYDVVKFEVDSPVLRELNQKFSFLPNHDSHPIYHPHMTLAYVRRGLGKNFVKEVKTQASVPVNTIIYSDRGEKTYYNLTNEAHNILGHKFPMVVYHGGNMNASKPVIFVTRHLKVAQSYAKVSGGEVHAFRLTIKNPASNEVVDAVAARLGIEGSVGAESPSHEYLSPDIVGHDAVVKMIASLRKLGFDSAWTDGDFSPSDSFSEYDSFAIWDMSQLAPV